MSLKSKVKKWLVRVDRYSPRPLLYSFIMTGDERALFDQQIKHSKYYLEFGSGGSTIRALKKSGAKIYSVDSNYSWFGELRKYFIVRYMEGKRLIFFHADIGPTKDWGAPVGSDNKDLFPGYSSGIFKSIKKESVDTVLVDGRFRVACVLRTILECNANDPLTIMIHDFWNREHYHILLQYLTETARAGTLGVFALQKEIGLDAVRRDYEIYKYDPS